MIVKISVEFDDLKTMVEVLSPAVGPAAAEAKFRHIFLFANSTKNELEGYATDGASFGKFIIPAKVEGENIQEITSFSVDGAKVNKILGGVEAGPTSVIVDTEKRLARLRIKRFSTQLRTIEEAEIAGIFELVPNSLDAEMKLNSQTIDSIQGILWRLGFVVEENTAKPGLSQIYFREGPESTAAMAASSMGIMVLFVSSGITVSGHAIAGLGTFTEKAKTIVDQSGELSVYDYPARVFVAHNRGYFGWRKIEKTFPDNLPALEAMLGRQYAEVKIDRNYLIRVVGRVTLVVDRPLPVVVFEVTSKEEQSILTIKSADTHGNVTYERMPCVYEGEENATFVVDKNMLLSVLRRMGERVVGLKLCGEVGRGTVIIDEDAYRAHLPQVIENIEAGYEDSEDEMEVSEDVKAAADDIEESQREPEPTEPKEEIPEIEVTDILNTIAVVDTEADIEETLDELVAAFKEEDE